MWKLVLTVIHMYLLCQEVCLFVAVYIVITWDPFQGYRFVNPGGPVVILLATGSEVRGFKPDRGRWIFSEHKNPEYDFLRKGSKAMGPVS